MTENFYKEFGRFILGGILILQLVNESDKNKIKIFFFLIYKGLYIDF